MPLKVTQKLYKFPNGQFHLVDQDGAIQGIVKLDIENPGSVSSNVGKFASDLSVAATGITMGLEEFSYQPIASGFFAFSGNVRSMIRNGRPIEVDDRSGIIAAIVQQQNVEESLKDIGEYLMIQPYVARIRKQMGLIQAKQVALLARYAHWNLCSANVAGHAVRGALNEILPSWEDALRQGAKDDLLMDLDTVIERLQEFRDKALAMLPAMNCGAA